MQSLAVALLLAVASGTHAQDCSLLAGHQYDAGSDPQSVAIGDLNDDGKPDIAVANFSSQSVSILLGDGRGVFSPATSLPAGASATSVAIGDLNQDGKPDLVVTLYSGGVSIWLADGLGGLSGPAHFAAGSGSYSVAIGDLNGDQKPDLAVANNVADSVSILLGNGLGGFSGPATLTFAFGHHPSSVAMADLTHDHKPDLVVANPTNFSSNNVSILLGDGSGGFAPPTDIAGGDNPQSVAIGDLNADNNPDLALAIYPGLATVLLGNGLGAFSEPTGFATAPFSTSIAIGDLNADDRPDLAVASLSGSVSVLLGNGLGGFSGPTNFPAASGPRSVAIDDVNGDSKPDLAVANESSSNVSVLLNQYSAGSIVSYGAGCVGSGGFVPSLSFTGCPAAGSSVTLSIGDALGGAPAFLLVGGGQGSVPFKGCTLLLDPLLSPMLVLTLGGSGAGAGVLSLPAMIPPGLPEVVFTLQAWIPDAGGTQGFSNTNGVEFHIE